MLDPRFSRSWGRRTQSEKELERRGLFQGRQGPGCGAGGGGGTGAQCGTRAPQEGPCVKCWGLQEPRGRPAAVSQAAF